MGGGRRSGGGGAVEAKDEAAATTTSPSSSSSSCRDFHSHSSATDPDDDPTLPLLLPKIIVFDLDDCLWTPEMHELSGMPSIPVEGPLDPDDVDGSSPLGTVGMKVPSSRRGRRGGYDWGGLQGEEEEVVELYPGARRVLREIATDPRYADVKVAVASTSLEPSYSRACLESIEVVEGVTMGDMISYKQIGRDGPYLTSRKTSHFRMIREESGGVPYEGMLFFDDCNWGDHVGDLNREFGVVGVRTPQGLRLEEFHRGLEKFRAGKARR